MIVLILSPAFEGVVVALIAIETRRQKEVSRIFHRLGGSADNFPIAAGGILSIRSRCSQNLSRKLIIRRVLFHLVANPGPESLGAFAAKILAVALKQVSPFVGPKIDVLRATN